jgi:hypothetical protein
MATSNEAVSKSRKSQEQEKTSLGTNVNYVPFSGQLSPYIPAGFDLTTRKLQSLQAEKVSLDRATR